MSANGSRVTLTRNIANIVMDLDGMERIKFLPRGGTDAITVEDVTGTDLDVVEADLGGDDTPDSLTKRGTEGPDAFKVGPTEITGVGARTAVTSADATGDVHGIAALGGDDTLATGLGVGGTAVVTFDGGGGDDTVNYSGTNGAGADRARGQRRFARDQLAAVRGDRRDRRAPERAGPRRRRHHHRGRQPGGADLDHDGRRQRQRHPARQQRRRHADRRLRQRRVDGQQGTDTALLGSGNDTFQWDPGDGNDTVDGQAGADALTFNGSDIGEVFHVSANGSRVNLTRNIANITMDLVGMERTLFAPRGGADVITVETSPAPRWMPSRPTSRPTARRTA